jgi:hypothetical protein
MTDLQRRPMTDEEFGQAFLAASLEQDRQKALARRPFPPVWHGMNPWSGFLWVCVPVIVCPVLMLLMRVFDPSFRSRVILTLMFGVFTVGVSLVGLAQVPLRMKEYGNRPDFREAWRAGWRWPK